MSNRVGILVEKLAIRKALRGLPAHEQISLYKEAAIANGIDIIVFSVGSINPRRHTVRGYVPAAQGWRQVMAPIPRVIHKRALYQNSTPLLLLKRLERQGVIFVNPHSMQNKLSMYELLSGDASVSAHIPPTYHYCWNRLRLKLATGGKTILKPMVGSVGRGIIRIVPLSRQYAQLTGKTTRTLTVQRIRRHLRNRINARTYLMQEYLDLACYNGRPFDLRVPVQRDGNGNWSVPGMVAKVAGPHPFLTNLAQGGMALPGEMAIKAAFTADTATMIQKDIIRLAINAAHVISRKYPYAADLGLDIGLSVQGKPWLIEVNSRDQRITFAQAGMHDVLSNLYLNPIAYCSHLLTKLPARHKQKQPTQ